MAICFLPAMILTSDGSRYSFTISRRFPKKSFILEQVTGSKGSFPKTLLSMGMPSI